MSDYRIIKYTNKHGTTFYYPQRKWLGIFWVRVGHKYFSYKMDAINCINIYIERKKLPKREVVETFKK